MQVGYTSDTSIVVSKCEAYDNSKTQEECYNDEEIKDYLKKNGKFIFKLYYLNPSID